MACGSLSRIYDRRTFVRKESSNMKNNQKISKYLLIAMLMAMFQWAFVADTDLMSTLLWYPPFTLLGISKMLFNIRDARRAKKAVKSEKGTGTL
jgi:hypothetical protein